MKHGTQSFGFIGLAETLFAMAGKHREESDSSQKLGLEIVKYM
jgi:anaerobic ribonucleoside-triphosphate reductase